MEIKERLDNAISTLKLIIKDLEEKKENEKNLLGLKDALLVVRHERKMYEEKLKRDKMKIDWEKREENIRRKKEIDRMHRHGSINSDNDNGPDNAMSTVYFD